MRNKLFILFFLTAFLSYSQSEFIREARYHLPRKDSLFAFESGFSGTGKYNYYQDSTLQLELMLNTLLKKGNRNRDTLKQSLVLTQLSTLCVKRIHSIMPDNSKRKRSLEKRIRRIFFGSNCSFGLIETISFEIPLVKKTSRNFHYNKKGADGGFNLYRGKSKPKATKKDPEPKEVPLEAYTYEEVEQLIQTQFTRKKVNRYLREKNIAAFGYYIQLDQTTVNKHKIPQLKVLLILGEKRFSYKQRRKFTSTPFSNLFVMQ